MPGSVTGTDMRKDSDAYEKSDVQDKVAATLAKFGEVEDDPTPEPEPVEPAEPSEPTPAEPKPADGEDPTPDPDPEPAEPEPADPAKPAIPDNYYRAAIHQGWKPERLSKLYEADPEGTLEFLKKNYEDVNNLSQQFANLGRKAKELESTPATPAQPTAQPKPAFDAAAFKKAYDEDPASAILMAMEAMQSKPQEPQPVAQPKQDDMQDRLAAIETMNGFFGDEEMKPFAELYGKTTSVNWQTLTQEQYANRQAVINRADEILAGAELLKTGMTVREAIERAHLELTAPMLEKIVRQDILKKVEKRAKSATLRPSKSKNTPIKTGGKPSEAQAIANAEARLADLRSRGL